MRSTEQFFARNPVFTLRAFAREVGANTSARTAYRQLDYHVGVGRLRRIRSGLYAVVPAGIEPGALAPDPYLVASAAGDGAPLGYHSALELLGVGHSVFHTVTVVSEKRAKPFEFDNERVVFVPPPVGLRGADHLNLGVTSMRHMGREIPITGRERTLVDCLLQPGRAGGVEEVLSSLSGFGVIDLQALQEYLHALQVRRAWAVTGYYLEKRKAQLFVPEDALRQLARQIPKARQYWVRGQRGGTLAKTWNLIVPEVVEGILGGD